jgi:choline dehydrogenase-like flavoprotein
MCWYCPVDAKFTVINDLADLFSDPGVTLITQATVEGVIVEAGRATGVAWRSAEKLHEARAAMVVFGANGIFNPYLLERSGITDGPLGKGLSEQIPLTVVANLDGMDDGDGSAHATGVGYNFAAGEFRRHSAGGFFETDNLSLLRPERGKTRQVVRLKFLLDALRQPENQVRLNPENRDIPIVQFEGYGTYALKGVEYISGQIPNLLAHLPVESIEIRQREAGGHSHLQGTTVMGDDPATSVIDRDMVHHKIRNLVVLGSGAFPTAGGANPTLTICALALRAADRLFGSA